MAKATGKKTTTSPASAVKKTAAKVASAVSEVAAAVTAPPKTPRARTPKAATSVGGGIPTAVSPATPASAPAMGRVVMTVGHDQIAQKAYEIWMAKGCPQGRDEENWREAEALLSGSRRA